MKILTKSLLAALSLGLLIACSNDSVDTDPAFSKSTSPDYATVFPQEKVNTMEITITKEQWTGVKADMKSKYSTDFGSSSGGTTPPVGGGNPPVGGGNPPVGGGGVPSFGTAEPDYIPVTVKFNGKTWNKVAFRLKGNSSLTSIWGAGIYKLPFRLKMDGFEDTYPETKDQRMYGFKDLSMSPNYSDNSLIREKLAADIFRMGGVPAAQTSFYKVYIDFGEGSKYCGIYTMVEIVDDTMVKNQFGEDKGNIYKPESNFTKYDVAQFEKKNNKTTVDYTDVQSFLTALNNPLRTTNAQQWRTDLEKTFDMNHYLKYLAINNTIVNWDAYGAMAHNYYLYNHPTKKLTWIPWDHNMSLTNQVGGGATPPNVQIPPDVQLPAQGGNIGMKAVSIEMTEVDKNWPLIQFVTQDPVYYAKYKQNVADFTKNTFVVSKMNDLADKYTNMISPFVNGSEKEVAPYSNLKNLSDFTGGLPALKQHISTRNQVATAFTK
jgi:spore coat protein H